MTRAPIHEQALILAGGLGTRLQSVLSDRPKVLAPIDLPATAAGDAPAGQRPPAAVAAPALPTVFLDVLLEQLAGLGFTRVVLLLGARHEQVEAHLRGTRAARGLDIAVSIEPAPLGTGGAVKLAEPLVDGRFVLINGDTFFDFDARALLATHVAARAAVTLGATAVPDAGRYGRLDVEGDGQAGKQAGNQDGKGKIVRAFLEKDPSAAGTPGLISAGVSVIEPEVFAAIPAGRAVSIERDVFPALLASGTRVIAAAQPGAFFDIGTPASYRAFVEYHWGGKAARASDRGGVS